MFTIKWNNDEVIILDQRELPLKEKYSTYKHYSGVARSITDMEIRGAPAIGVAAAMGIALAGINIEADKFDKFKEEMNGVFDLFASTRPTAVNLFWSIERMKRILHGENNVQAARERLKKEAIDILNEDIEANKKMGKLGSTFLEDGDVVMTHCNAGALATGGYGTALGVIRAAVEEGKQIMVYSCETRPYLQGARLTSWELMKDNIPVTVITDNMSGYFMKSGIIKKVIVGADRIAANGDTANKIGTYMHAVLARENHIPFYVAAPVSTIDPDTQKGSDIPIEERGVDEVAYIKNEPILPQGVFVRNPAFDVTPAEYISAIITERGIIEKPNEDKVKEFLGNN